MRSPLSKLCNKAIAICLDFPSLLDIALVYSLLSFLAGTTFCAIFTRNLMNERNMNSSSDKEKAQ